MSLINEALKKAQKQRTGAGPSAAQPTQPTLPAQPTQPTYAPLAEERPTPMVRHTRSTGMGDLLVRISLGVAVLIIVIGGTTWYFRGKGDAPIPVAPPPLASLPAPIVAAPQPVAIAAPPPVAVQPAAAPTASTSTFVVPNVMPVAVTKAPDTPPPEPLKVEPVRQAPVAVPTPVAVPVAVIATPAPAPEPAAVDLAPGKMEPRAIDFIEGIRVAGIRASSTDSKVLMNDRVYRLGDTVDRALHLKLVEITSSSLTFEDSRGSRYTRGF